MRQVRASPRWLGKQPFRPGAFTVHQTLALGNSSAESVHNWPPEAIAPAAPSTGSAAASGTFDPLCKVLFALRTVYLCAIDHRSIFVLSRDTPRQTWFSLQSQAGLLWPSCFFLPLFAKLFSEVLRSGMQGVQSLFWLFWLPEGPEGGTEKAADSISGGTTSKRFWREKLPENTALCVG
jgi:hypothetical protein